MIKPQDLLRPRPEGLYCPPGDFYIDPVRPVSRAGVTQGHADHARAGHGAVLAALRAAPPAGDPRIAEGLMLKRLTSIYEAGRPKGPWFKWKRDPFLIDAVLMYAQRGHGKRSSFHSDYTFGVWIDGPEGHRVLTPGGQGLFRLHRRRTEGD